MPDLKAVEEQIVQIEKFTVRIRNPKSGKNRQRLPDYPYQKPSHSETTVRGWKEQRFAPHYPGHEVDVVYGDGALAPEKVSLMSVRLSGIYKLPE